MELSILICEVSHLAVHSLVLAPMTAIMNYELISAVKLVDREKDRRTSKITTGSSAN